MPGLGRHFQVVAPDQRGTGLSGKPGSGYDTATLARHLVALMDALGHHRFAWPVTTPACGSATPWRPTIRSG